MTRSLHKSLSKVQGRERLIFQTYVTLKSSFLEIDFEIIGRNVVIFLSLIFICNLFHRFSRYIIITIICSPMLLIHFLIVIW